MVVVVDSSLQADSQTKVAWSEGRRPLGAVLHPSNEPSELSQPCGHDDSTINIVLVNIILICINDRLQFAAYSKLCLTAYPTQFILNMN